MLPICVAIMLLLLFACVVKGESQVFEFEEKEGRQRAVGWVHQQNPFFSHTNHQKKMISRERKAKIAFFMTLYTIVILFNLCRDLWDLGIEKGEEVQSRRCSSETKPERPYHRTH